MKLRLLALFLLAGITAAHAHAFLDSAEPAVGSTVHSPGMVKIWFTRQLKTEGSSIAVFNPSGAEVDGKTSAVDPKDRFLMSVAVPKLPPGLYKVGWNAVCLGDGHHTTGSFTFTVAK